MTATNAPAAYRAELTIGEAPGTVAVYVVKSTDPLDDTDPSQVLDSLRVGWAFPSGQPWPSQPDPVTLTVGLLAKTASDFAWVTEGTPIALDVYDDPDAGDVWLTFRGRVGVPTATPVRRPSGPRTVFTLPCLDYTIDLRETVAAFSARPGEEAPDRVIAMQSDVRAAAGGLAIFPDPPALLSLDYGFAPAMDTAKFEATAARTTDVMSAFEDVARQENAVGNLVAKPRFRRWYVRPMVGVPGYAYPFKWVWYSSDIDAVDLPGVLEVDAGILGLVIPETMDALPTRGRVAGSQVPFDSVGWRSGKSRAVSVVTVTGNDWAAQVSYPSFARPVKLELSSTLDDYDRVSPLLWGGDFAANMDWAGGRMGVMYLPDEGTSAQWEIQEFRYLASSHLGTIREFFPDHTADPDDSAWPIGPVVITDVPDELNLNGPTGLYAGQLVGASVVIERRRCDVTISLRRNLPAPKPAQAKSVTPDYIEATFPTIDVDHVDPDLTVYDLRLARRP